jgi:hypothetical protein
MSGSMKMVPPKGGSFWRGISAIGGASFSSVQQGRAIKMTKIVK